jgi:hypothetical protein
MVFKAENIPYVRRRDYWLWKFPISVKKKWESKTEPENQRLLCGMK